MEDSILCEYANVHYLVMVLSIYLAIHLAIANPAEQSINSIWPQISPSS